MPTTWTAPLPPPHHQRVTNLPRVVPSEPHTYALGDVQCAGVPLCTLHEKYVQNVSMLRQRAVQSA